MKSKLFRNVSFLTISQFTTMAVPLLSGIWIAGQLSEQEFGAYRLLLILITFLTYTTLGAELRLMYQFPEAIGRGVQEEIEKMPSTFHSILVLNRSTICVIALALALFNFKLNGISIGLGWLILSIGFAIDGWGNLYEMVIRSFQKFMHLSAIRVSGALCYLLFLYIFLKTLGFGILGILISLALSGAVKILLALYWSKLKLSFGVTTKEVIEYVKYGFPLKINSIIWTLLISVNIWLVSYFLSPKDAGILGYAMMTSGAFTAAASVFTEILSVRFIQYSGKCSVNGNTKDRFQATYWASVGWAGLNLVIAISVLTVFALVITLYMPKYSSAWDIIIINMIGYYAYSIIDTIANSEIISGRANNLTKLFATFFVIELISSVAICKLYPTLENITTVQSICLTLLAASVAYQHWRLDISEISNRKRFLKLAALVAIGIAILASARFFVSLELGIASIFQGLIILLALIAPILWFSYRGFITFYGHVSQLD